MWHFDSNGVRSGGLAGEFGLRRDGLHRNKAGFQSLRIGSNSREPGVPGWNASLPLEKLMVALSGAVSQEHGSGNMVEGLVKAQLTIVTSHVPSEALAGSSSCVRWTWPIRLV